MLPLEAVRESALSYPEFPVACNSHSVTVDSFRPHGLPTDPRILCPWNFPAQNTGVGSHSHLQGTFPIQGFGGLQQSLASPGSVPHHSYPPSSHGGVPVSASHEEIGHI